MADSLVLNWSKTGIVAISASVSGQQVHVGKTASLTWTENAVPNQNPVAAGHALKTFLQQSGLQAEEAVVCLSRDAAVTRMLDVPRVSDDELTDIVRLQAATRSSQPADQLLIDYLPQPPLPGRELGTVLAATLNRSTADNIRKVLTTAGVQITGIGLSSVGLAELATGTRSVSPGEMLVGAVLIESRLEVSLIRNGNIPFLQSAVLTEISDEAISAELRRILFSAQQKVGDFDTDRLLLFVNPDQQKLFPQLQEEYGEQLSVVTLTNAPQVRLGKSLPDSVSPAELVCPLGLLLNRTLHTLPGVDFLHPREKLAVRSNTRRKIAVYAAGAVTLIGLSLYGYYSHLRSLDNRISRLKQAETDLKDGLNTGAPALQADADLQEWLARDVHTLLELEKMEDTLPGTAVAYLNEYNYDVALGKNLGKVSGKGMALDRDKVEQIYRDFDAAGFNVYAEEIEITRRDSEYPAQFTLTLERPAAPAAQPKNTRIR